MGKRSAEGAAAEKLARKNARKAMVSNAIEEWRARKAWYEEKGNGELAPTLEQTVFAHALSAVDRILTGDPDPKVQLRAAKLVFDLHVQGMSIRARLRGDVPLVPTEPGQPAPMPAKVLEDGNEVLDPPSPTVTEDTALALVAELRKQRIGGR